MKTIRVQYDEPARSKSRNVNAYTRAAARRDAMRRALTGAELEARLAFVRLTGGQRAEAERALGVAS